MTDHTDDTPQPIGTLAIQTIAMPQSANWNGDIFAVSYTHLTLPTSDLV